MLQASELKIIVISCYKSCPDWIPLARIVKLVPLTNKSVALLITVSNSVGNGCLGATVFWRPTAAVFRLLGCHGKSPLSESDRAHILV